MYLTAKLSCIRTFSIIKDSFGYFTVLHKNQIGILTSRVGLDVVANILGL